MEDLGDAAALDTIFARHRPEAVLHFAALIAVGESVADPLLYYRNNVAGSLGLLEAMRRAGCGCIVFSSSAGVGLSTSSRGPTSRGPREGQA